MADSQVRGWLIAGRVQGVFFRESTRRQAEALGLSGQAINLDDGRVEVLAQGSSEALDQLAAWLQQGPPAARVDRVSELEAPGRQALEPGEFRTG